MKGHTLRGPCGCSDEEGAKILMETFSRIVGEDEMKTRYHRGVELSASRTESMISTVVKSEDGKISWVQLDRETIRTCLREGHNNDIT